MPSSSEYINVPTPPLAMIVIDPSEFPQDELLIMTSSIVCAPAALTVTEIVSVHPAASRR